MNAKRHLTIRTGCLACRERGVRCEPDKNPQCQQHSSARWSSNRSVIRNDTRPNSISQKKLSQNRLQIWPLDLSWQGTLREKQSLHFFSIISAPELSGHLDGKFWQLFLLQATHCDEAMKHAVAAIGASHERQLRRQVARNNQETDGLHGFALRQCNKAIKSLVRPTRAMSEADLMRALTAAVLFACYESVNGNRDGAVPHVIYARKLLDQHRQNQQSSRDPCNKTFPVDIDTIEPLVAHFECQIGAYVFEDSPEGMIYNFDANDKPRFRRLTDARVSLERAIANLAMVTWNLESHHTPGDIAANSAERSRFSSWLHGWDMAFADLLARERHNYDRSTLDGCRLLKAHHAASSTLADADYDQGEATWALFTSQFKVVVDLITEVLNSQCKRGAISQVPPTPYLSPTMGMTEPLYCASTRCADPVIAERAKMLLSRLPLSEGVHSAWKVTYLEKTLCAATGRHHTSTSAKAISHRPTSDESG